jgi:hypothetical protein
MKLMLTFTMRPEARGRDEAIARFKKTGGKTPAGVKLLGRWTRADFGGGYVLVETDDAKALTEFGLAWSDLMELTSAPVVDDEGLVDVLQRVGK